MEKDWIDEDMMKKTIIRQVIMLSRMWERILDRGLKELGITFSQFTLLAVLEDSFSSPPTIADAAALLMVSHQNVMKLSQQLKDRGFLDIIEDPEDRRSRRLVLTEEHYRFWEDHGDDGDEVIKGFFEPLRNNELSVLSRRLGKMTDAAGKVEEKMRKGEI